MSDHRLPFGPFTGSYRRSAFNIVLSISLSIGLRPLLHGKNFQFKPAGNLESFCSHNLMRYLRYAIQHCIPIQARRTRLNKSQKFIGRRDKAGSKPHLSRHIFGADLGNV